MRGFKKTCYECQRLNHSNDVCPLLVKKRKEEALGRRQRVIQDRGGLEKFIGKDDPFYGVLSEDQVGICRETGRRKVAPEVLEEMRRYMMMATDDDKLVRMDRVRSSMAEAEKDPFTQKSMLRLESTPQFTKQLDKGKGVVYDFHLNVTEQTREVRGEVKEKLMDYAFRAGRCGDAMEQFGDMSIQVGRSKNSVERKALSYPQITKAMKIN
ncbi:uncharacterized protein LOC106364650 [Brassica napus]|uniref:uncharacterized protein LOC106364650 n=1 Tax=Brassica napus TaxID=3708 RepID=UPI0006AA8905|nr:uncharacterized protein LOC106364650 [Brassica napus]